LLLAINQECLSIGNPLRGVACLFELLTCFSTARTKFGIISVRDKNGLCEVEAIPDNLFRRGWII
jgi:hypothetical protein